MSAPSLSEGQRNSDEYDDLVRSLTYEELTSVNAFLIGYLAGHVERKDWSASLAAAGRHVARRRQVVSA